MLYGIPLSPFVKVANGLLSGSTLPGAQTHTQLPIAGGPGLSGAAAQETPTTGQQPESGLLNPASGTGIPMQGLHQVSGAWMGAQPALHYRNSRVLAGPTAPLDAAEQKLLDNLNPNPYEACEQLNQLSIPSADGWQPGLHPEVRRRVQDQSDSRAQAQRRAAEQQRVAAEQERVRVANEEYEARKKNDPGADFMKDPVAYPGHIYRRLRTNWFE